jgi:methionyl-tRNA formyltransferase
LMGERNAQQGEPGRPGLLLVRRDGVTVRCGGTTYLRLLSVKLEGRKQVSAAEFVHGAHLLSGEHFGES